MMRKPRNALQMRRDFGMMTAADKVDTPDERATRARHYDMSASRRFSSVMEHRRNQKGTVAVQVVRLCWQGSRQRCM
jgi:hypothetical protein